VRNPIPDKYEVRLLIVNSHKENEERQGEEANMGLKKWLAGKVAGPQSYGDVLGRHAREGGSALANMVFMSHGTRPNAGPTIIFDTVAEMEAAGFNPRFTEITEIDIGSLSIDEQLLLKSLQRAMISFAFIVNSNGALQYMRRDNTSKFRNGLGPSLLKSMVDCGLFERIETAQTEVLSYAESVDPPSSSTVLKIEKPASGDLLELFILRAVGLSGVKSRYGFTRTGLTGFDVVAVSLVEETLKSIAGATLQYKW
jgi:hypothetical protein